MGRGCFVPGWCFFAGAVFLGMARAELLVLNMRDDDPPEIELLESPPLERPAELSITAFLGMGRAAAVVLNMLLPALGPLGGPPPDVGGGPRELSDAAFLGTVLAASLALDGPDAFRVMPAFASAEKASPPAPEEPNGRSDGAFLGIGCDEPFVLIGRDDSLGVFTVALAISGAATAGLLFLGMGRAESLMLNMFDGAPALAEMLGCFALEEGGIADNRFDWAVAVAAVVAVAVVVAVAAAAPTFAADSLAEDAFFAVTVALCVATTFVEKFMVRWLMPQYFGE